MRLPTLAAIDAELMRRGLPRGPRKAWADDLDQLPALVRLAERLEPEARRRFLAAVRQAQDVLDLEALARMIEQRGVDAVLLDQAAATLASALESGLGTALRQAALLGAAFAAEALQSGGVSMRFDLVNPRAVSLAQAQAARLVREIGEETRQAIQDRIVASFTTGIEPRALARQLQGLVGLTARQAESVDRFAARLAEQGVSAERAAARTARYAEAQVRQRSLTIARTEIMAASNAGQQALWMEARGQGLLSPNARQVWIVTPDERLCEECEPMDGETAPIGGLFPGGSAGPILHPQCRCTMGLIFE